jgi:hypothetical protein
MEQQMKTDDLVAIIEVALVGAERSAEYIKRELDMSDAEFDRLLELGRQFNNSEVMTTSRQILFL